MKSDPGGWFHKPIQDPKRSRNARWFKHIHAYLLVPNPWRSRWTNHSSSGSRFFTFADAVFGGCSFIAFRPEARGRCHLLLHRTRLSSELPKHHTMLLGQWWRNLKNPGNFGQCHFFKVGHLFWGPKSGVLSGEVFPRGKCQVLRLQVTEKAGVLLAAAFCFFEEK